MGHGAPLMLEPGEEQGGMLRSVPVATSWGENRIDILRLELTIFLFTRHGMETTENRRQLSGSRMVDAFAVLLLSLAGDLIALMSWALAR
jgi:hypothetical protein